MTRAFAVLLLAASAYAAGSARVETPVESQSLSVTAPSGAPVPGGLAAPVLTPALTAITPAAAAPTPSAPLAQIRADAPVYAKALAVTGGTEKAAAAGRARFDGVASAASAPDGPAVEPFAAAAPRPAGLVRWGKQAAGLFTAPLGLLRRPRNDRDWSPDNARPPRAEFSGEKVTIRDVRDFAYRSPTDYDQAFHDETFDLREVEKVWFVVEPFGKTGLMAHTFLTFDFKGARHLSVSVEIRKVAGESFSPWMGLFNHYELAYIVGTERDLIGLRVNHRKSSVYMHPIKAEPAAVRAILTDMLSRATALAEKPEFYNTLANTCLSNILRHLNHVSPKKIGFGPRTVFPGLSDRLAYNLGLLDTTLSFAEERQAAKINDRAGDERDAGFSGRIRRR